jgi:hypothetical protein
MSTISFASSPPPAPATAPLTATSLGSPAVVDRAEPRRGRFRRPRLTLARRFLAANLIILVVGGLVV